MHILRDANGVDHETERVIDCLVACEVITFTPQVDGGIRVDAGPGGHTFINRTQMISLALELLRIAAVEAPG